MPERIPLDAGRLADLAERVAAHLGPAMLAEDAPEPPPLAQAAWHAMNALQRVAEQLPGGQLAGEPDTRLRSLNDLASHGESIVQAAMECLITEGYSAPDDIDQTKRRTTDLEQQVVDLKEALAERDQELDAARGANRDLISRLNRS